MVGDVVSFEDPTAQASGSKAPHCHQAQLILMMAVVEFELWLIQNRSTFGWFGVLEPPMATTLALGGLSHQANEAL